MSTVSTEIRRGAYFDSVVLMELQSSLKRLPEVLDVGVMMATAANKDLLNMQGLLDESAKDAQPEDLIICIKAANEAFAQTALAEVDNLLVRRRSAVDQDYLPKSLAAATKMLPDANWVLVSVPGQYATRVAREALELQKNVFLYSDNVSIEDEVSLKQQARRQSLLVMGPDCGTAIVNGIGFGFANQVRRGPVGLVGASGTGLQHVTSRIHQLGGGITHALGTGGRDLSTPVAATTALQSLDLLRRDPETKVIVLISKPPAEEVAAVMLRQARMTQKPVVVNFIGHSAPEKMTDENLHFARSLDEAAELAVGLGLAPQISRPPETPTSERVTHGSGHLRGLFSGGTLAHEVLLMLRNYLPAVYSNIPLNKAHKLPDVWTSQEHTIIDLGEDEFTVGRPHPMLDNTLRLQRLQQEADDPSVGMILLDVVLGHGAHPDPAAELAPAISAARAAAKKAGRNLEIVALVVGTDDDPQGFASQVERLQQAGARVEMSTRSLAAHVGQKLPVVGKAPEGQNVDLKVLQQPVAVLNVGLESFAASIKAQEAEALHVDWRPPAGGNDKLLSILERMKKK